MRITVIFLVMIVSPACFFLLLESFKYLDRFLKYLDHLARSEQDKD